MTALRHAGMAKVWVQKMKGQVPEQANKIINLISP